MRSSRNPTRAKTPIAPPIIAGIRDGISVRVSLIVISILLGNWKGLLNEWAQKSHIPQPAFTVVDRQGSDHAPVFKVQVTVNGDKVGEGTSSSKKEAEQIAAKIAYGKLVKA